MKIMTSSRKQALIVFIFIVLMSLTAGNVMAQSYTYAVEDFESATVPTADPGSTVVNCVLSTGTWKLAKAFYNSQYTAYSGSKYIYCSSTSFQLVSPVCNSGVGIVTFYAYSSGGSNRTLTVSKSVDGTSFTAVTTTANLDKTKYALITVPVNDAAARYVKITVGGGSGVSIDYVLITSGVEAIPPTVTTQDVTAITKTTATGNGTITALGDGVFTSGICWKTATGPTTADSKTTDGPTTATSFTGNMTGLAPGQTYYVKAYAANGTTGYGNEVIFTTLADVTTAAASEVTQTSATCGGTLTSAGAYTQKGVCWSANANPTIDDNKTVDGSGTGNGTFVSAISGLSASSVYHARAYVTNATGTTYGEDIEFTTLKCIIPANFTTAGTTAIRSWENAVVYLTGSEENVTYQLLKDGVPYGSKEIGSENEIDWFVTEAGTYTVKTTSDTGGFCETLMPGSAVITIISALHDAEANKIGVTFINNQLQLSGLESKASLTVYDITGRLIQTFNQVDNNENMQLKGSGIYLVHIETATQSVRTKIAVQ